MHPHALWVIRHGQTEWNLQHRWQGRLDSPLTDEGRAQARAVGKRLAAMALEDIPILASPQGRARETALLITQAMARPAPPTDPRLAEIDVGDWTGWTRDEIATVLGPWESLFVPYNEAPGGEGIDGVATRIRSLLADLTGPTVLITHGITSRILRAVALGLELDRAADLPGGQGVIHHVAAGQHNTLDAESGAWV